MLIHLVKSNAVSSFQLIEKAEAELAELKQQLTDMKKGFEEHVSSEWRAAWYVHLDLQTSAHLILIVTLMCSVPQAVLLYICIPKGTTQLFVHFQHSGMTFIHTIFVLQSGPVLTFCSVLMHRIYGCPVSDFTNTTLGLL